MKETNFIFIAIVLIVSTRASSDDFSGACFDCKDGPKPLSKTTEQYFRNAVAIEHDTIQWYCDPNSRKLYVTDKSKVTKEEFFVSSYYTRQDCQNAEYKLNRFIPRIVNTEGKFIENQILVCFHEKFYLVNQNTPFAQIPQKGKLLTTRFALSADDCTKLPEKFTDSINTKETLKLIFDSNRVDSSIFLIKKNQKEFLDKKFTND